MYVKLRLLRDFFPKCPVTSESFYVSFRLVGESTALPSFPSLSLSFAVSFVLFLSIRTLQGFICTSACLPFSPSLHADRGPFSTLRLFLLFFSSLLFLEEGLLLHSLSHEPWRPVARGAFICLRLSAARQAGWPHGFITAAPQWGDCLSLARNCRGLVELLCYSVY